MFLERVTVTGADESVKPSELARMTYSYPFAEWGILISKSGIGVKPKCPSLAWIRELATEWQTMRDSEAIPGEEMACSLHLCGRYARDIVSGVWTIFDDLAGFPWHIFSRFQLNISPQFNEIKDAFWEGIENEVDNFQGKEIILQINPEKVDLALLRKVSEKLTELEIHNSCLYDGSGGKGVYPAKWVNPCQEFMDVGFAGGLDPHCLEQQIDEIRKVVIDSPVCEFVCGWIDTESRVRTPDNKFNLALVEMYLKKAKRWFMIHKTDLDRYHDAAKMIEVDGVGAYVTCCQRYGTEIANFLLVAYLRSIYTENDWPEPDDLRQRVNSVLSEQGFLQ